jgi:hypothetical protein
MPKTNEFAKPTPYRRPRTPIRRRVPRKQPQPKRITNPGLRYFQFGNYVVDLEVANILANMSETVSQPSRSVAIPNV